jgi:hypothetical protein
MVPVTFYPQYEGMLDEKMSGIKAFKLKDN